MTATLNGFGINGSSTGKTGTFTAGFSYRSLTPSNLTGENGILITQSDNLQYSRGSLQGGDGSGVVYENFDPNQGTLEFWVRPSFSSADTNDYYVFDVDTVNLYWDGSATNWVAEVNGQSISRGSDDSHSAGDWVYLLVTWDNKSSDTLDLDVDGNSATQVTSAQTVGTVDSNIFIGQGQNNANVFMGVIAGRVLNKTTSSNYNSGNGSLDTFAVTPETVWMGTYSDTDDDAVFWHRGQQVTATTTTAVTVAEAVGSRSWADNDRVVVWDGCGYKKEALINGTPSSTNIPVDDGAGGAVTDLDKVGASLDFDATYNAQAANNTIHDITTEDIGVSVWVRLDTASAGIDYVLKKYASAAGYEVYIEDGIVTLNIGDGTDTYKLTGNTDIRDNKWHHIVGIIDKSNAANCKIYLDGYEDGTTSKTGTLGDVGSLTNADILDISDSNSFDGQIRDVILAYPADIMAANEMGVTGEILTLATNPRDFSTVNSEDYWELTDNASSTTVAGANNNLTASANTDTFSTQEAFISKNLIADSDMEDGGIGPLTLSNIQTVSKDISTVKFDTRGLKIAAATADWASVYHDITVGVNENYLFKGWHKKGTDTNQAIFRIEGDGGFAAYNVEVNKTNSSWDIEETAFKTTGTQTYSRIRGQTFATAIGGFSHYDQLQLLPNLVDNGGMESTAGGDPELPTGWSNNGLEAGEGVQEDTVKHSGAHSWHINADTSGEGIKKQSVTVVNGAYYTLSLWLKIVSGNVRFIQENVVAYQTVTQAENGNTWRRYSYTGKSSVTSSKMQIECTGGAAEFYVDDVSLVALDQISPSASTPSTSVNSFNTGKYNQLNGAVLVDGLDTLDYANSNNINANKGTVGFWAYINNPYDTGDDLYLFDIRGADDNNRIAMFYSQADDKFTLYLNGAERIEAAAETDNTFFYAWVHFSFSWDFDNDLYALYRNSVSLGTDTTSLTVPAFGANQIHFGSDYNNANQADAFFDDIRVYDYYMTASQHKKLYDLMVAVIND
tara:strand:+ start:4091 stop:7126 length:3036 start_codon:yes stop_codon:yes gene_type:complete